MFWFSSWKVSYRVSKEKSPRKACGGMTLIWHLVKFLRKVIWCEEVIVSVSLQWWTTAIAGSQITEVMGVRWSGAWAYTVHNHEIWVENKRSAGGNSWFSLVLGWCPRLTNQWRKTVHRRFLPSAEDCWNLSLCIDRWQVRETIRSSTGHAPFFVHWKRLWIWCSVEHYWKTCLQNWATSQLSAEDFSRASSNVKSHKMFLSWVTIQVERWKCRKHHHSRMRETFCNLYI